jgi:hypothetical protein
MAVMLIARFDGDVGQLRQAYDRAHALIMSRGGATGAGELRHHCAIGEAALYIIGVWESEERVRARWGSGEFEDMLTSVGFPAPQTADITILKLHATDDPGTGEHVAFLRQGADGHQCGALTGLRTRLRRSLTASPCIAPGGVAFWLGELLMERIRSRVRGGRYNRVGGSRRLYRLGVRRSGCGSALDWRPLRAR